ncbi:BspA family leucine-rich repeat surface protein, partial [Fulvivirga sp.]
MKKFLLTYLFLVPSLMAFGQITYNVTTITELRNAIISANSDGAVSIINLENASYTVGRFGNGPDGGGIAFPEITENFDLIINGDESDITVATTGTYRFFYVTSTGRLILNKLFLYNGQPEDDYAAGAVYNEGYLEANNVLFQGHRSGGNDGNNAGAIYNEGDAYFRTCEFVSNVAQGLGGLRGGAIFNTGLSSTLTVEQCTFYQNSAIGRGSALGINNGSVDVINSTFYENTDEAIYLAGGQLVLNSCTISGNEANNFGGDNGTVVNEGGSLFLRYNIIGQNETSGGSLVITDPNVYDIKGSFTDFGYNVIGQFNTGSLAGTSVNTSILFFDFPNFGYNGSGFVRTIPILASSPALDLVPTSQGSLPGYDQRGYVYEGAAADAGAYELNGTTITSIATGNWSEDRIWSNNDGPFSSLPTIIATGTVVTMDQNGSTGGLTIDGGGNLNAGTFNLSISGDFNASTSPSNSLANLSNANIFFSNVGTYTDPVGLDFGNVTISGASLDLANPLRARSMTINNTRTLNANGNNIEIFGTGGTVWSQLGTFNPGGAGQTVTFTGAAPTINGTNFQNLTINSSGTATSLNDLTMAEQLDVTAGSFVGGVLVQTNGDITINTTGNVDQSDMDSQGGNISVISSAGSLTLGDVTTGAGDCSFTANGDITLALIDASAFGQGGTVSINSGAGSIDVNTITTESTGGSSSGGDVNITTSGPAGDITLGGNILTSGENGAGSVFINSPQSTVSGSSTNIESLATFGFGFTIEVTGRDGVTGFANITGRGNVTIGSNLGDVSVTDVDSNGGSLEISASGNISAGALSTTFGNAFGNLNMNGSGNATVTSITTGPSTSGSGDISVLLGGSFDVTSGLLSSATNSATAAGAIDITAGGDFVASAASLLDLISTDGSTDGGSITLNIGGNILDPLSFRTDGATTAGNVSVSTTGSGATNISTLTMTGGPGGNGSFAANVGGDLIISDVNGVNTSVFFGTGRPVDVSAEGNISISGPINSSSSNGDGGNISLTSNSGEVLFSYINAQSPSANGGNVTLSALTNVIGSASFSNLNGNNASISTVGGTSSGSVFISHNDGNPQDFEISQGATSNGLFSSLAADPLVASDNFLNSTVVGGNYTSGDTRVVIRSPGPPFVTTWQTTTPGESITVPTLGGPYLYDVDWGDGSPVETGFTGNAQHNYATAGTYTVSISGTFPRIYFADGGDKDKIRTIEQWGNIAWTSMGQAFQGCSNLTYNASDVPDLTLVTDISLMFAGATSFNGDISAWNTTGITFMLGTFSGATSFNQNLTGWNVSNVTTMQELFSGATSFNNGEASGASGSPLSWTTSSLQNTNAMFLGASSFNQNVNSWDVSGVTDMFRMFESATVFNQPLNTWDVSLVTSMGSMFKNATAFNQPLNSATWNTANVVNFGEMFFGASAFDQPLDNNWSVASTVNLVQMFAFATSFNQPLNQWGATKPSNAPIVLMFEGATSFNQPLSAWDVSGTDNMFGIFKNAAAFDQDLSGWDVTGVTVAGASMEELFDNSGMSPTSYDATLLGWSAQTVQPNIVLGVAGLNFCDPTGRDVLLAAPNNWTIIGDNPLVDRGAVPQASQLTICDGDSFDFNIGSGVQTGYTYKLYSEFVDLGNRGNQIGTWTEGAPLSAVTLTAGSNGIVIGDNLLIVVAEDNSSICEVILDASLTITVNPLPTVVISGDATICEGESTDLLFTLTGTGPYDVTYNDGTADVDLIGISDGHLESVAPTSTTSYTLISVADANSCSPATVTGSVEVTVNPLPTVAIGGGATICEGESTDLLFTLTGTGPYDVTYNDGTVDVDLIGISNGHLESVTPTSTTTY